MTNITQINPCVLPASVASRAEADSAMSLGISFNGSQFVYQDFRYDKLSDAVAYAELVTSRVGGQPVASSAADWHERVLPNSTDRSLMTQYGITFEEWRFKYKDYRYDRLADAVNYAASQRV